MNNIENIIRNFQEPDLNFKPFVRWWWFGNGITKEEIERQLKQMASQGIGGAEIQSIYSIYKDYKKHTDVLYYLSDKWLDLIDFTSKKGKELGIQIDLTFGNGWPFGGSHITPEFASSKLQCKYGLVIGGRKIKINLHKKPLKSQKINVVIARKITLKSKKKLKLVNLTSNIKENSFEWNFPLGIWLIYYFYTGKTKQKVKRAAPRGEGWVLDHLNREAFKVHANYIGEKLKSKFGDDLKDIFGSFFCDSWEVYGENWTYNFLSKFLEKMEYDLSEFLPYLGIQKWIPKFNVGEKLKSIRYDYKKVHSDLILEEFFAQFVEYSHKLKVQCRAQPYSAPTDLLKAYGLLDILEIEGFGKHGIGTMYYGKVDPRLASSGAHIYKKHRVSCESFTWLGEHFSVSLEDLKRETDQIILHGVNRIIYHGFPYSPLGAGIPGWVFYASILANNNNTWWKYIVLLNNYIARNSYLSYISKNIADFVVYLPIHDEWCGVGNKLKEIRIDLKENGHLSDFDYVNDDRLRKDSKIENFTLKIGSGNYKALIIWNTEYIPLKTANSIQNLVNQGMNLVIIGEIPSKSPGYKSYMNNESNKVEQIFQNWYGTLQKRDTIKNVFFYKNFVDFENFYNEINIIKDFKSSYKLNKEKKSKLKYLHQKLDDLDLYFIVNETSENFEANIELRCKGNIQIWDSMRGKIEYIEDNKILTKENNGIEYSQITLKFNSYEAKWVVIGSNLSNFNSYLKILRSSELNFIKNPEFLVNSIESPKYYEELNLNWNISFYLESNTFPEEKENILTINNSKLFDWTDNSSVRYFSGTAIYKTSFSIELDYIKKYKEIILDLGLVYNIAHVYLNDKNLGVLWWGEKILDISDKIQDNINQLEIHVTNLLLNKIIGYDKNNKEWKPDYYFVNQKYLPFTPKLMKLLPSGLIGPIKLKFY